MCLCYSLADVHYDAFSFDEILDLHYRLPINVKCGLRNVFGLEKSPLRVEFGKKNYKTQILLRILLLFFY